ncbi:hypothetical protein [Streptomonospora arabica]|uniref:Uncharacterized protein n=1 Tax=Streptomonospora arabica TaxID=412417 RepID=A0ABV9STI8_9ACTN
MRHQHGSPRTRFGRPAAGAAVAGLATALVGSAVFGVGAFSRLDDLSDGSTWLWSAVTGEVIRVNANNGRVDLVHSVDGAEDHPVRLAQNNRHLVLHDLEAGSLTSVNLARMEFTGESGIGSADDNRFVLGRGAAVIIAEERGEVRRVDPETLRPAGEPLRLGGRLVGGQFDAEGVLWVASPSQGTVVGIDTRSEQPEVVESVPVGDPGDDLAITVLDSGALAVNTDSDELSVVTGGSADTVESPVGVSGAEVTDRTEGGLAAVTVPDTSSVVAVEGLPDDPRVRTFTVHGTRPDAAVPFAGDVYVPYSEEGLVRRFSSDGRQRTTIRVPDAGESPLELEVRDEHLFINAPESESALVVDSDGGVRKVSKYDTDPRADGPGGAENQGERPGGDSADPYVEGPDGGGYVPEQPDLPDASTPEDLPEPPGRPEGGRGEEARPEEHEDGYEEPSAEQPPRPQDVPDLPDGEWAPGDGQGGEQGEQGGGGGGGLPDLPPGGNGGEGPGSGGGDDDDEESEDGSDDGGLPDLPGGGILDPQDPEPPESGDDENDEDHEGDGGDGDQSGDDDDSAEGDDEAPGEEDDGGAAPGGGPDGGDEGGDDGDGGGTGTEEPEDGGDTPDPADPGDTPPPEGPQDPEPPVTDPGTDPDPGDDVPPESGGSGGGPGDAPPEGGTGGPQNGSEQPEAPADGGTGGTGPGGTPEQDDASDTTPDADAEPAS